MSHDRQFFDTFLLVLGSMIAVAIGLFFLARYLDARTQQVWRTEDPLVRSLVEERITPVGRVVVTGEEEPVSAPVVAAPEAVPVAQAKSGDEVYNSACAACHMTGAGGAPKLGDTAAWGPRIAKGQEALLNSALNGITGEAGMMPPKGGRIDLSDEDIAAAVDYMIQQSQ